MLPANGDAQGSKFDGTLKVTGVEGAEGAKVYSTTETDVDEDPNAKTNGKTGEPSDIWEEGLQEDATAVRVITRAPLAYGDKQTINVKTELHDADNGDVVVNKAVGRAENTRLRMRTSAQFTVRTPIDVNVEKVWKNEQGENLTETPNTVKVQLIRKRGEESTPVGDKVELSAAGGWKHTFEKLPTAIDGDPVTYTVKEDSVEGYNSAVEVEEAGNAYEVTVTNTRKPEPTPEPTPDPSDEPTPEPTPDPSDEPTPEPSDEPTPGPSGTPTPEPSEDPTPGPAPREPGSPGPGMPRTGAEFAGLLAVAVAAIGAGTLLMLRTRRS